LYCPVAYHVYVLIFKTKPKIKEISGCRAGSGGQERGSLLSGKAKGECVEPHGEVFQKPDCLHKGKVLSDN
jgi:hypothetical protein